MSSSGRNTSRAWLGPALAVAVAVATAGIPPAVVARAIEGPAPVAAAAGVKETPGEIIPAIAPRVAAAIAEGWRVPAETIRLQWGRGVERIPPDASFRLIGKGADGWFALSWKGGAATTPLSGAVRVRAGCADTLFVAARPLGSGARIADGDIRPKPGIHWGPPTGIPSVRPGRDWEIRRPLATGDVVAWPAAVPPPLILKGQEVRMDWRRGDVAVSLTGVAMNAARMGETVRVRVSGRSRPLVGTVVAPGCALLVMGGTR